VHERPLLAVTMGDINGIGPEIIAKALARPELFDLCTPVVLGSIDALDAARAFAKPFPPAVAVTGADRLQDNTRVQVIGTGAPVPAPRPGMVTGEAGRCAVEWLRAAVRMTLDGETDAVVTCPISKSGIQMAGFRYAGHTEIIAEMTGEPDLRMCLFSDRMRIVHVTAHCSLREVPDRITPARVERSIVVGHDILARLGLSQRRIAVAGLNPHSSEEGLFGNEEAELIVPAVAACKARGIDCEGPFPPDTVFRRMVAGAFDLVVAMYHDQGHIPFKLIDMDDGVQATMGIPIIRTSVDHGTAYDIAGRGVANEGSLFAAMALAARLARGGQS
jgi:4-phospho-D-threonate 3-dehydrogenase / 4-phospho-D-erythronate 3-dehydrogenase